MTDLMNRRLPLNHRRDAEDAPAARHESWEDQDLFEQAVGELTAMSRRELAAAKSDGRERPSRRAPARFRRAASRGEIEPDATLDLHGLDRREAIRRLKDFLRRQGRTGESRTVLIVHGKGTRVLAEHVGRELDHEARVAEHFQAPPRLGGEGARIARLKTARFQKSGG